MNKFAIRSLAPRVQTAALNSYARAGVATSLLLGAIAARAADGDDGGAVAAIASAKATALSVAGGLVGMGVAIWGAMFLYRKFFK